MDEDQQSAYHEKYLAQYAVLEANTKVNGRGQISHRFSSKTPEPIWIEDTVSNK